MDSDFEHLLVNAHRTNRNSGAASRGLYRRLEFVAKVLRNAPPLAAARRLLWIDRNDAVVANNLDDEALLGRDPSCAIVLAGRGVSRRHCAIHCDGGFDEIVDLNSANGTRVNGVRIERRILADGDLIEIGDNAIVYSKAI